MEKAITSRGASRAVVAATAAAAAAADERFEEMLMFSGWRNDSSLIAMSLVERLKLLGDKQQNRQSNNPEGTRVDCNYWETLYLKAL